MHSISSPKILFASPSAYTLSGVATWLNSVLPGLTNLGWNSWLGLVDGAHYHKPDTYLNVHPWEQTISIACRTGTSTGRMRAMLRAIDRIRPDVVVSVNQPDAILAGNILRRRHKFDGRLVMACHGIQRDLFTDAKMLSSHLDGAISTNRLAQKLMEVVGELDASRTMYAACGVGLVEGHNRAAQRPLKIAYVGRIEEDQKRISDVVAIASKLYALGLDFELVIAGSGPEEADFRHQIERAGLLCRVKFLGQLSATELTTRVYSEVDVLLLTSHWETGPIVAWEAMANGVVFVSSKYVGSGREQALLHGENCLLFDIGDCDAAAMALARVAAEPDLVSRLRTGGRKLVESQYSNLTSVRDWDHCFRAILNRPALPPSDVPIQFQDSGRLDRWIGSGMAEWIRERIGKISPGGGPGDEWPHTLSGVNNNDSEFWELVKHLDVNHETQPVLAAQPLA